MSYKVGMFDKSYEHIGQRLDALGLDIEVTTFDRDGRFAIGGKRMAADEVDIDYLWLSSHINSDGFRDAAFKTVLACRSVGVLQTFNAGLDHPFYKTLSDKGTRICNSSAQGVAIAEYVMAQVLAVMQPIAEQRALQAAKQWKSTPFREISETRWLIVGFGPIGQEIAKRVTAFGASTTVIRRSPQSSDCVDTVGTMADLQRLLPAADIVVLACALNEQTRGFAGAEFFAAVKPGAILVNVARGGLVDDTALLGALDSGRVATAILDVFRQEPLAIENPLWTHKSVRITSHTSFFGSGVRARWDRLFLDNISRFASGQPLAGLVSPKDVG